MQCWTQIRAVQLHLPCGLHGGCAYLVGVGRLLAHGLQAAELSSLLLLGLLSLLSLLVLLKQLQLLLLLQLLQLLQLGLREPWLLQHHPRLAETAAALGGMHACVLVAGG